MNDEVNNRVNDVNNARSSAQSWANNALSRANSAYSLAAGKADANHNHDGDYVKLITYNTHFHRTSGANITVVTPNGTTNLHTLTTGSPGY